MVRLLRSFRKEREHRSSSFNPTMVRLLREIVVISGRLPVVSIPQWCDCCSIIYTVTNHLNLVSIPQWCDCCRFSFVPTEVTAQFQSHNGAIAAGSSWLLDGRSSGVSIPQWCDCCNGNGQKKDSRIRVSIPQWCDCCNFVG